MLGLKLNHISKGDYSCPIANKHFIDEYIRHQFLMCW